MWLRDYIMAQEKKSPTPTPPRFSQCSSKLLAWELLRASASPWQPLSRCQPLWVVGTHEGNKTVAIHQQDCTISGMARPTSLARKGRLRSSWEVGCLSAQGLFPHPSCTIMDGRPRIGWNRISAAVSNQMGNPAVLVLQRAVWEALEPSSMVSTSGRTSVGRLTSHKPCQCMTPFERQSQSNFHWNQIMSFHVFPFVFAPSVLAQVFATGFPALLTIPCTDLIVHLSPLFMPPLS